MEHFFCRIVSFGDMGLYPYLKSEERYFDASGVGSFLTLKISYIYKSMEMYAATVAAAAAVSELKERCQANEKN